MGSQSLYVITSVCNAAAPAGCDLIGKAARWRWMHVNIHRSVDKMRLDDTDQVAVPLPWLTPAKYHSPYLILDRIVPHNPQIAVTPSSPTTHSAQPSAFEFETTAARDLFSATTLRQFYAKRQSDEPGERPTTSPTDRKSVV